MKTMHNILDLKPTQFAVGMLEVDEKIKIVEKFSKKEMRDFLRDNPVPVVISPRGEYYIVDHHHFLCVCYHIGIRKVRIEVKTDLSDSGLSFTQFWKWMLKTKSMYPFCQFGEGPREPFYLPKDIRGLADDPYRSLAWFVRKSGAFENSEKNFAEFQWANFFRRKKLLDRRGVWGFARALVRATKLAQSSEAKKLPGYGKLNLVQQRKTRDKLRKHIGKEL
ncbi:MAG: ParB/Srx family N-terminal domain-containing protein [Bdellovibrionota bacterium]